MPSPFPGMDPWLEDSEVFPNLHDRLGIFMQDALNAVLPPGYVATTKNRVVVDEELVREPDVALFGRELHPNDSGNGDGGTATALAGLATITSNRLSDPEEEAYLEIRSARGKRLVTAIEIISLANKRAGKKGRQTYQDKQAEYRSSGVNLVEIDLLRAGPHVSAIDKEDLQKVLGGFDYHVSVVVAAGRGTYHAAGIKLADRLPAFAIPLDRGVAPVMLDLQPLLDRAYDGGRYTELFDYGSPCNPPLSPEQQTWAEGILRAKGLLK